MGAHGAYYVNVPVQGSTGGHVQEGVDDLRDEGESVGLREVRSFRPLPTERIRAELGHCAEIHVLDRADTPGGVGALHAEVAATIWGSPARLSGHVYGLGGRDLSPADIRQIFAGTAPRYVGLRGLA